MYGSCEAHKFIQLLGAKMYPPSTGSLVLWGEVRLTGQRPNPISDWVSTCEKEIKKRKRKKKSPKPAPQLTGLLVQSIKYSNHTAVWKLPIHH